MTFTVSLRERATEPGLLERRQREEVNIDLAHSYVACYVLSWNDMRWYFCLSLVGFRETRVGTSKAGCISS